jgi:4Fe-4S single cluster domain
MKWRLLRHVMMVSSSSNRRIRHRPLSSSSSSSSTGGFTYFVGGRGSLYIPLTSYCNARTLPETRGPNFRLPQVVVAALCAVRDAERQQSRWRPWCQWLLLQDTPQKLPPPQRTPSPSLNDHDLALALDLTKCRPTVDELLAEIDEVMRMENGGEDGVVPKDIVIAGEGEPTLALDKLLELLSRIRQNHQNVSIRINTNGLIALSSSSSTKNNQEKLLQHAQQLSGIAFSVPIMTNDPHLYGTLMDVDSTQHAVMLDFVRQAVALQLAVEITAVDRPELVDRISTERLAREILGVVVNDDTGAATDSVVRWRPYFP